MAVFSGADQVEFERLQQTVSKIVQALADVTINSDVANALATYLNTAQLRLLDLEEKGKAYEEEKQRKADRDLKVALVEREIALSHQEREQYEAFLEKDHFTKSDFGALEKFYANTWDRLTEGGKDEMSHRVWEGVRKEEYKFSELPDPVKDKEAQRLRDMLGGSRRAPAEFERIPAGDKEDFIRTWDAGEKERSYKVLDRKSFTDNVALSSSFEPDRSAQSTISKDTKAVLANSSKEESEPTPAKQGSDVDLSSNLLANLDAAIKPSDLKTNGTSLKR